MSVKLKPLGDRIVAQVEAAESKTASGLYLPDNAKEKSKVATVLAVGPDATGIKIGDRAIFKEYSTTEVKVDGSEYILVKAEDVLATLA